MCHAKCESSQASAAIVIHNPGHPVESARNARAVILQRFGNLTNQKYGLGYVTCLYSGSLVLLIIQAPIFRIPGHFAGPMHEPRPRSQNPGAKKDRVSEIQPRAALDRGYIMHPKDVFRPCGGNLERKHYCYMHCQGLWREGLHFPISYTHAIVTEQHNKDDKTGNDSPMVSVFNPSSNVRLAVRELLQHLSLLAVQVGNHRGHVCTAFLGKHINFVLPPAWLSTRCWAVGPIVHIKLKPQGFGLVLDMSFKAKQA